MPKPTIDLPPSSSFTMDRNKPLVQVFNSIFYYMQLSMILWNTVKGHISLVVSRANWTAGLFTMTFLLDPEPVSSPVPSPSQWMTPQERKSKTYYFPKLRSYVALLQTEQQRVEGLKQQHVKCPSSILLSLLFHISNLHATRLMLKEKKKPSNTRMRMLDKVTAVIKTIQLQLPGTAKKCVSTSQMSQFQTSSLSH